MKKQDQTVENMIMQAHYLEALEIESKTQKPLAEKERQDFIKSHLRSDVIMEEKMDDVPGELIKNDLI